MLEAYFSNRDRNPQFSFENYLENPLQSPWLPAHIAIKQYFNQPTISTPLFIHGPYGSGKTHLAHAIAGDMQDRGWDRIIIRNCESYEKDLFASIHDKNSHRFRHLMHTANVLIIDDIDHFSHKNLTQENLTFTFKALQLQHRPIIFTSSSTLEKLHPTLLQIIASSTMITTSYPDLSTKIAFLERIFSAAHKPIDTEIIRMLASRLNHVPELEGVANTLIHSLKPSTAITAEMAEHVVNQKRL